MYTFVTGGYRSGRTNYALRRASELGPPPWLYVSAGAETDDAIRKRIERHRRDTEAIWRTGTMARKLDSLIEPATLDGCGSVVFDGVGSWLGAALAAGPSLSDAAILDEVDAFVDRLYRLAMPAVVVSTEMGLGGPPLDPDLQRFAKLVSSANQIFARQAADMVLMVSGVPIRVR